MPTPYIQNMSEKTGMSIDKLEGYWDRAKEIALKDRKESDENFWGYVTGIFKNMIGESESVNESVLVELVDAYFDYVCEEGEIPTQAADIAKPDRELFGKPVFRVSSDMFHKIGFQNREKRKWYQNFYGSPLGNWCRSNKGKPFTIENEESGWLMDIDRDRFDKFGKETIISNEKSRKC
jgi:hypothetical protein